MRRAARIAATLALLAGCAPGRGSRELPSRTELLRLIEAGSARNVAAVSMGVDDPRLRPHVYPLRPSELARSTERAVERLPRWEVIEGREGVIWLTRRTRLGFVDDVHLLLLPVAADSTAVLARSASRVGWSDFGQNRRNLGELWSALDAGVAKVGQ